MNIKDLLEKGYFPKELPPPFTTKYFADKSNTIEAVWSSFSGKNAERYKKSTCVNYSIPKVHYSRRNLGIPNPLHQVALSKTIHDNWTEIDSFCKKSTISASRPVVDDSGFRAVKTLKNLREFKTTCLKDSFSTIYEVETDISRFYPTIYTHTIPWALHTKQVAKLKKNDKTLLGNVLDTNIRACQSSQSVGIPIGPDTSLIIAELIGCAIDIILQKRCGFPIKGYRYVDDYHLFFSNLKAAEEALKTLQSILTDFELDISEEKTDIRKFPLRFKSDWPTQISSFVFRDSSKKRETDIERYFRLSFQLADENPKDAVIKYAIQRLVSVSIEKENWDLFESLLLKATLVDPSALPETAKNLVCYKEIVNKEKLRKVIGEIIESQLPKGHAFETSWALWLAKIFNLKIRHELAKLIFNSNDVISILIALDLKNKGLIDKGIDVSFLQNELTLESLFGNTWLLTYEATIKNWLTPGVPNLLDTEPYFSLLKNNGVFFYDENQKLEDVYYEEFYHRGIAPE